MKDSMGLTVPKNESGFSALEVLVVVAVIGILAGLCIHPLSAFLQRIRLQNAADNMKHYILNARIRAVSNSERHCGVVFRVHAAPKDDTVFAFLEENPPDNIYTKGKDSLYLSPFVVKKSEAISSRIAVGFPALIVFRGDGSATASAKVVLTLKANEDTVEVLASTGKVKVVVK